MPRKLPEISVSPSVLRWARETAGYHEDAVARRLGVDVERVKQWESAVESARLTPRQLEDLAQFFKRPMAALLLLVPPEEPRPPQDYRRPFDRGTSFSHDLRLAIRRAFRLQRYARGIMEALDESPVSTLSHVTVHDDPSLVAHQQRQTLGILSEEQFRWRDAYEALRAWRDAVERTYHVLTFQAAFPRDEAQGFSLSGAHPYVIVMTTKDLPTTRCFTLFHEFAHLLLGQQGVCLTEEAPPPNGNSLARIERWCHQFAEAFLVDADALRAMDETSAVVARRQGYEAALRELASAFKVNQPVVLYRLWRTGLIPERRFHTEYARVEGLRVEALPAEEKEKRKGGPHPAQRALSERGPKFTNLVLEALDREVLDYTDVIDYLGVRPKHLDRIRQTLHA